MTAPPADPPVDALSPRAPRERAMMYVQRKLLILVLLVPFFAVCYYLPQWLPLAARREIPLLAIDRAVPFQPGWIWPYMSMYLLLPLPPVLSIRADHLRRYSLGMALMFVTCCVFFFGYPIAYPRPELPADADWFYRHIAAIDQPINSLPSLHAGLTVYALLYARRALADLGQRTLIPLLVLGWIWAVLILYGTLATKQHYLVDLPAGAVVAWVAHYVAWRGADRAEASAVKEAVSRGAA
ncbi:MAG: phosphatase PAP2 family protein [Phycisphaerae bacterium]